MRGSIAQGGLQPRTGVHRNSTEQENIRMNARDEIIDWLRDAYAMERGLETTLQKQTENDDLNPNVRARAAEHRDETHRHADEVRAVLQSLGTDTSALKT